MEIGGWGTDGKAAQAFKMATTTPLTIALNYGQTGPGQNVNGSWPLELTLVNSSATPVWSRQLNAYSPAQAGSYTPTQSFSGTPPNRAPGNYTLELYGVCVTVDNVLVTPCIAAAPEPAQVVASLALAGIGAASFAIRRYRKRNLPVA